MSLLPDLQSLPCRGVLSDSLDGGLAIYRPTPYVCVTEKQQGSCQTITSESNTALLIRLFKKKPTTGIKPSSEPANVGKRPAIAPAENPSKKANTTAQSEAHRQAYTQEELKAKSVKELQELLKARSLSSIGRKEELLRRLIDYQRRVKLASQPA